MHEISFDRVESRRPLRLDIAPDAEDLRGLAVRFGWVRVDALAGDVVLTRISPTSCQMRGKLTADIVMTCGVSGDDVPTHLEIDVDERFAVMDDGGAEVVVDAMGVEAEPIVNGTIPLWETLAQLVALAAPAWPRGGGLAPLKMSVQGQGDHTMQGGMLEKLAEWKKKR